MSMWGIVLYGHDTKECLDLRYGRRPVSGLSLSHFEGPKLWTAWLGHDQQKLIFLPRDLLTLLYQRFAERNPSGLSIADSTELEARFAPNGMSPTDCDELYDQRKLFVNITFTDESLGYPHLKPYLPEVFDEERLAKMAADPALDAHLLDRTITHTSARDPFIKDDRWSPEWLAYCQSIREK